MRTTLFSLICLGCLLAGRLAGAGQPPGNTPPILLDPAALEQLFLAALAPESPFAREELQILNFKARPETLRLPPGTLSQRVIRLGNPNGLGQKTMTLAILVNGQEEGQVTMSGDLALFGEVVTLAKPLPRDTVLSRDELVVSRRNLTLLGEGLIRQPEEAVGKQLQAGLPAGSLLYEKLLKSPPLVKRGDRVTIRAKSARLQINVNGEIQNAGGQGDQVRVKNLMSRKELYARVITPTMVEVEF